MTNDMVVGVVVDVVVFFFFFFLLSFIFFLFLNMYYLCNLYLNRKLRRVVLGLGFL